jgi:hypothetical protein
MNADFFIERTVRLVFFIGEVSCGILMEYLNARMVGLLLLKPMDLVSVGGKVVVNLIPMKKKIQNSLTLKIPKSIIF